jgi:hypothetical protein
MPLRIRWKDGNGSMVVNIMVLIDGVWMVFCDEERCAVINLEHEIWEEKDCTLRRHFICKKKVCKLLKYIVAVEDTQRPYTFNRGKKGNETPPSEKSQTIEL